MATHRFTTVQSPFLTVPSPLFYPPLTGNGGRDGTTCAVRFVLVEPRGPKTAPRSSERGATKCLRRERTPKCDMRKIGDRVLKSAEREWKFLNALESFLDKTF